MRVLLLAMVMVVGCTPAAGPRAPRGSPQEAFARLVDRHFDALFAFEPTMATRVGDHARDGELEDLSKPRIATRVAELRKELDDLAGIELDALPEGDKVDAKALENAMRAELYDLEVIRPWEHDPMTYAGLPGRALDALMKRELAPGPERVRLVTARMKRIPALLEAAHENLRDVPKVQLELAVRMAKGSVKLLEGEVSAWATAAMHEAPPKEFEDAREQAAAAARAFEGWLSGVTPTGSFALGDEKLREKLRLEEMIDVPLDQLLSRGEAQLAKDWAAFVSTALTIDPNKTPREVMRALSADHPAEGELVEAVAKSVEDARAFVVEHAIATIPSEVRPTVRPTPPFARAAPFDQHLRALAPPGPLEAKATEAFYYVTPVEPEWDPARKDQHLRMFNRWVTAIRDVHEVWPGHYLQSLWAKRLPSKTRKLVYATSNGEGWAHYAEQMMVDQGFGGGDPRMRLAQLQEALVRDCRYVAAIKLHTMGWTVERAAKLFEEKAFQEPANALEEAKRGAYDPTSLAYTWGKLEIQALAKEYRDQKKASLAQFHDAFVSAGALPLPLVRRLLLGT